MEALDFFHPVNFDFHHRTDIPFPERRHAWIKTIPPLGDVSFALLSWQHAQQKIPWQHPDGTTEDITFLGLVAQMQSRIWGMSLQDALPPIDMAIISNTGGYLGVAYRDVLTADTWLGFVLGFGSINGVLASHMLGTNPHYEGHGIGYHLKLLQAYEALRTGHHAMEWTFDPMRGKNAYLNFCKLGAYGNLYLVSKYGEFRSTLYGIVPSDRFVMRWDLTDVDVQNRLLHPQNRNLNEIASISIVNADNVQQIARARPPLLKFEIPGDIDTLTARNPEQATNWRHEMRLIGTRCLDSKRPIRGEGNPLDPATLAVQYEHGDYYVSDFVTGIENNIRRSFYLFTLKE